MRFKSANFRYAVVYMIITFVFLALLNIYCSKTSQNMFHRNNKASVLEKCSIASAEIAKLDRLTNATVSEAVSSFTNLNVNRMVITDHNGLAVYDSGTRPSFEGKTVLLPEVASALAGNDVFIGNYHDGIMRSCAAMPIYAYGTLVGCVYINETNATQGALIARLQGNVFTITVVLEIIVIICSLVFSSTYFTRFRKIMSSIRNVREGDYSHQLELSGNDELNDLGNEFNDLIGRLQRSENKRNQFVSDASHELKTPLASIKLLSDSILQNDLDTATIKEFIGDIGNEADRLNRMSQKLLTLSRTDGSVEDDFEITSIAPTIHRIVRMLSEIAQEKNIEVITNIKNDSTILIQADDLYQILFNLIENGIKYNKSGGKLEVDLDRKDSDVLLRISDTGVGIPEDSLKHIFERFYRVDKARSRSTGGSGLGLSIVRNMVKRNGGSIDVQSAPGHGTTFTLSFPAFDVTEGNV